MASTLYSTFLCLFFLILVATNAVSARTSPKEARAVNMKQPETFDQVDGTVEVPGLGRFVMPEPGSDVNPFTYNPITGQNGGTGISIPGIDGSAGPHNYKPGGDDTLLPFPNGFFPFPGATDPTPTP